MFKAFYVQEFKRGKVLWKWNVWSYSHTCIVLICRICIESFLWIKGVVKIFFPKRLSKSSWRSAYNFFFFFLWNLDSFLTQNRHFTEIHETFCFLADLNIKNTKKMFKKLPKSSFKVQPIFSLYSIHMNFSF